MIKNESIESAIRAYLDTLEVSASKNSVRAYTSDLADWRADLEAREIRSTRELSRELKRRDVRSYVDGLQQRLARSSVSRRVYAIIGFLKWLRMRDFLDSDLWVLFPTVKLPKRIPSVLSFQEAFSLLHQPDTATCDGARDRAIIEVMYGSGLRVEETVGINVEDIKDGFVRILGKGSKERSVPLTHNALKAITAYLDFREEKVSGMLFRNFRGGRITSRSVSRMLKAYMKDVHPGRRMHSHMLRHSCATHIMSAGADLATVSQLLGHANISTTQRYLFVDMPTLRGDYLDAHPIAKDAAHG